MNVIFSDQAIADLKRIYPEENKFVAVRAALIFALKKPTAEKRAVAVNVFPEKNMYDYPIDGNVALYQLVEQPRQILVWSVHEAADDSPEFPAD